MMIFLIQDAWQGHSSCFLTCLVYDEQAFEYQVVGNSPQDAQPSNCFVVKNIFADPVDF